MTTFRFFAVVYLLFAFSAISIPVVVVVAIKQQPPPIQNVQVILWGGGKIYYVSNVTTANELQQRLEEESGMEPSEQGRVVFQGKVLHSNDSLSESGMKDGDQINMMPISIANYFEMIQNMGNGLVSLREKMKQKYYYNNDNSKDQEEGMPEKTQNSIISEKDRNELKVMEQLYDDVTKLPYMQEQMEAFALQLRNPHTLMNASDPERVESIRQIILNNPLFIKYISNGVGMDILEDSDAWYRHMQACVKRWATMDGYELWQMLWNKNLFKLYDNDDDDDDDKSD